VASGVSNTPELTREQVQAILVQPLEQAIDETVEMFSRLLEQGQVDLKQLEA
jgi:hypothetical protein